MIEASGSANRFKETDELMLITNKGQMVRTRVREIRETGRNTMGVKLIDLRNGEKLQAIAPVVSQAEEEEAKAQKRLLKNPERVTTVATDSPQDESVRRADLWPVESSAAF